MNFLKRDFIIREPLLVGILVLLTVIFSALTHAYSRAYDSRRSSLGIEWFQRGQHELAENHPPAAVEAFRTALLYDPRNWEFRMQLAEALTRAGHTDQAFNYYLGLWQSRPNNGPVNLQLARLSARKGDSNIAERYFNGAIFGDWSEQASDNRRAASLELIQFYLDRGDAGHAESQLIILSDNLPEDPQLHARVASLFSRVGDDQGAFAQYRRAERLDPTYLPAVQGAGEAAFRSGDYHAAQTYLNRALRLDESNASARKLLPVIQSLFLLNPYQRGISEAERIKRSLRAFDIAGKRLQFCPSSPDSSANSSIAAYLERWKQLKVTANAHFLSQHPEEIDTLVSFSISVENLAQSRCAEPTPDDFALLALTQQREREDR